MSDPRSGFIPWHFHATCELDTEGHEITVCARCGERFREHGDFYRHALEHHADPEHWFDEIGCALLDLPDERAALRPKDWPTLQAARALPIGATRLQARLEHELTKNWPDGTESAADKARYYAVGDRYAKFCDLLLGEIVALRDKREAKT